MTPTKPPVDRTRLRELCDQADDICTGDDPDRRVVECMDALPTLLDEYDELTMLVVTERRRAMDAEARYRALEENRANLDEW
jgi:hypothetical protein